MLLPGSASPAPHKGTRPLAAGGCMYRKPGIRHSVIDYARDLEVLEITTPAGCETATSALARDIVVVEMLTD